MPRSRPRFLWSTGDPSRRGEMKLLHRILLGTISGTVATGPMSVAMILLHRRLPLHERYPLPPRRITARLAEKTGLGKYLDSDDRDTVTLISHFAYGGLAGALYSVASDRQRQGPVKGALFGLVVWAVSYHGWLPAARILSPATEHPERRNLLMIVAHLIWGAVLGSLLRLLAGKQREE